MNITVQDFLDNDEFHYDVPFKLNQHQIEAYGVRLDDPVIKLYLALDRHEDIDAQQAVTPDLQRASLMTIGIFRFEISIASKWKGVHHYTKLYTNFRTDALSLFRKLVSTARELYNEELQTDRYRRGEFLGETVANEDLYDLPNTWEIRVFDSMPCVEKPDGGISFRSEKKEEIAGCRLGAYRLAKSNSKVFVSHGGRDCDRVRYHTLSEFSSLREAADAMDESAKYAEGPWGYSVISRDEFETYEPDHLGVVC